MRTDKKALLFAGRILLRCVLVGVLFSASAYVFKHAPNPVLLAVFLMPVAVGLVLAGIVLLSPKPDRDKTDTNRPRSQ